ncbi:MAG: zinc ribbon domain-containing protein [Phycisphaerae bacterium]
MLLADSVILIVFGLLLIGIIGFFFMSVVLVTRFFRFVFRLMAGTGRPPVPPMPTKPVRTTPCPAERCGNPNPVGAQYCARCGRPLAREADLDAYG